MSGKPKRSDREGAFAYQGLDRVLHEKARLGILTALLNRSGGSSFVELKRLCDLTDGNLARHLQTLQEAELVEIEKNHEGRRPVSTVKLTKTGRKQFVAYLAELERVIRDARQATAPARGRRGGEPGGLAPA